MKRLLILTILLFLTAACGGKKVASTKFTLNAGALLAGSNPAGGVFIHGSNGVDQFSTAISAAQANNFSIDLPFGEWNFAAVAWLNGSGVGPMTGKTRCAISGAPVTVQGTQATISLNLTHAACTNSFFATGTHQDSITFAGETTFKKLNLESCLNPVGVNTGSCNGTALERLPGEHTSFKLKLASYSTFGANLPSLVSACFSVPNMNSGFVGTEIRLPTARCVKLPVER